MAVPKPTQTRYMDGSVQRTTQVTPSLHHSFHFWLSAQCKTYKDTQKKDVGMGLLV